MDPFILAVDIGTGSVRASLFDDSGDIHFTARSGYQTEYPRPGWSEQNADSILSAAIDCIGTAVSWADDNGGVAALSFSSQMYSVLGVASDGEPLTPALPWMDSRSEPYAAQMRPDHASLNLSAVTGCPPQAVYPLAKIGWLRDNHALSGDVRFVSIKDFVVGALTGDTTSDWSTSSASGLFDIRKLEWAEEALSLAGLSRDNLAPLASPRRVSDVRGDSVLGRLGVDAKVILGAGDAPLSTIGCGAVNPDTLAVNVGTSAAVRRLVTEPTVDTDGRLWTYFADEGHWVTGGSVGSAGSAFEWVLSLLSGSGKQIGSEEYHQALDLVETVPAGTDDLLFLPYLVGEQCPDWRSDAQGAFVGLSLKHRQEHLLRAVIEGVAFALRRVRDTIELAGGEEVRSLSVTGSLGSSPTVRQIIADVFGLPVVLAVPEGSSRGAAILAWIALGRFKDYEDFFQSHIEVAPHTTHHPSVHEQYNTRYEGFAGLTRRLWSGQ